MAFSRETIQRLMDGIRRRVTGLAPPMSQLLVKEYGRDPFVILISCLLSLRARDVVTYPISQLLLKRARTPQALRAIPLDQLETLLYPLGFYRRKAQVLHDVSDALLDRFGGVVPSSEEELLSLPGVGRKTANLVRAEAFEIPAICVDTHVHRLANYLGLVSTKTPEETEYALQKIIPEEYWIDINRLLVTCGQNRCDLSALRLVK